jgi:nickel/cobalt tolerance cation efflux system protein
MTQYRTLQTTQQPSSMGHTLALRWPHFLVGGVMAIATALFLIAVAEVRQQQPHAHRSDFLTEHLPDLAMSEGDPYIRALMLTISASESNHKNSYFLLYGGSHVHNLEQHPNQCLPIKVGPNRGKCSTAAGRYQFLPSTWLEKAARYHPHPQQTRHGVAYGFEPEYQDKVVYRWLKDHHQWDVDIPTLLRQGRLEEVLLELSDVWTSLDGGIEENSMTPHLPELYRKFLAQELQG